MTSHSYAAVSAMTGYTSHRGGADRLHTPAAHQEADLLVISSGGGHVSVPLCRTHRVRFHNEYTESDGRKRKAD